MYTLLTRNILKNYRISNKTIKRRSMIINDLSSMMLLPFESKVLVFFEHSISLSHLMDLKSALNLDITLVVNNKDDYDLCSRLFQTKQVAWDFIDGDLINSIMINDEKQMEALSNGAKSKASIMSMQGLVQEAKRFLCLQVDQRQID